MKNLHEPDAHREILDRMAKLRENSKRAWGTMSPDQMIYHCNRSLAYVMGEFSIPVRSNFIKRFVFKPLAMGKMPFPKGRAKAFDAFIAKERYNLGTEKKRFEAYLQKYAGMKSDVQYPLNPLLGKLTAKEWGRLDYKHIDHHLRQFGL